MIRIPAQQSGWPANPLARQWRQWFRAGFPDANGGLYTDNVVQTQIGDSGSKLTVQPVTGICYDYPAWNSVIYGLPNLSQCDLWLSLKLNVVRNARLFPALIVIGPDLRQVQAICNRKTR